MIFRSNRNKGVAGPGFLTAIALLTLADFVLHSFILTPATAETPSQPATQAGPTRFVSRRDDTFSLDGREFRVAGVNIHYLPWGSQQEVTRVLDDAVAMKANVVRTFVAPIIGSLDGSLPTIWNWASEADSSNLGVKGTYMAFWNPGTQSMEINRGENGLKKIDFILAEASKRNLRVILAFLDYWAYTGGAPQMSAWHNGAGNREFFATSQTTREDYKKLVEAIIHRTNTLSGVRYADDPTIFAWELMNEPEIHPTALFSDWVREMAAYVKRLDSRHLLATGQDSTETGLVELHDPNIDFGTWHGYAEYQKITARAFQQKINTFCDLAHNYGKPVLLEEFGLAQPDRIRGEIYKDWLSDIASNKDCAGWMVWRLVSTQDTGRLPFDYDQFDVHNDGGLTWRTLQDAARALTANPISLPTYERN
jgi:mannan endo-1,4-beta-mannosidase